MTMVSLEDAFSKIATQPLEKTFFRVIHAKYAATALSAVGSYRFGGRYNPAGSFEVLYLADSPVTALEEVKALLRSGEKLQGVKGPPRILLSVACTLQAVISIRNNLNVLGLGLEDIMLPWRASLRKGETPVMHTLDTLDEYYNSDFITLHRRNPQSVPFHS